MYLEKLNWPPTNQRFKQGVTTTVFKFVQNKCSSFLNEIFRPTENIRTNTKNSYLKSHFSRTSTGQSSLSYIGHEEFQKLSNSNTFKHNRKHYYLNDLFMKFW